MNELLKPCPVCGGEASLEEWMDEADDDALDMADDGTVDQFQVICGECDGRPPGPCGSPEEAMRRWNAWSGEPAVG